MSQPNLHLTFFSRGEPVSEAMIVASASLITKSFAEFNTAHGAHPDVVDEEFGNAVLALRIVRSCFDGRDGYIATNANGDVVGITFIDVNARGSAVAVVGPVASSQKGAGRMTVEAACAHAEKLGFTTPVLMQIASNTRSFSLYAKLGFKAKHTLHYVGGFIDSKNLPQPPPGVSLDEMTMGDVDECAELFEAAYTTGASANRKPELTEHVKSDFPFVRLVARDASGTLVRYSTGFFMEGHVIANSQEIFCAMFGESSRRHEQEGLPTPRFHIPMEYTDLVSWSLKNKLTYYRACIVMAKGEYKHAWPDSGHVVAPGLGW